MRNREVKYELIELNNRFRSWALLDIRFYEQMLAVGLNHKNCFIVELIPDGSETYVGTMIDQYGELIKFDVDLEDANCSNWSKLQSVPNNNFEATLSKTWKNRLKIAYELFEAMS